MFFTNIYVDFIKEFNFDNALYLNFDWNKTDNELFC